MTITIYGIKNCDTMKKARAFLDRAGVDYAFHDYKTADIGRGVLQAWSKAVGWEVLLNRAGTTFRKLPDADKAAGAILELVIDSVGEANWTDKMQWSHPIQTDAQEPVEAGKVIHVSVRHKGMADAQELAR